MHKTTNNIYEQLTLFFSVVINTLARTSLQAALAVFPYVQIVPWEFQSYK